MLSGVGHLGPNLAIFISFQNPNSGEMTAASLEKIKEKAFIADPTSYDIPAVSLVMLDECSCIRHVMSTSLEPEDAVEAALNAAKTMNTCRYSLKAVEE